MGEARTYVCWSAGQTTIEDDWRYSATSPEEAAIKYGNACTEHEPFYTFTEPMDVAVLDVETDRVRQVRIAFDFKAVARLESP